MKSNTKRADGGRDWVKTATPKLWRYVPANTLYARVKVSGKLYVKSLETELVSLGRERLAVLEVELRSTVSRSPETLAVTLGAAVDVELLRIREDENLKPRTADYYSERVNALRKSWSGFDQVKIETLTEKQVEDWARRVRSLMAASSFNATVGLLRRVMRRAIKAGLRCSDPFDEITGKAVVSKRPSLPSSKKFGAFVENIRGGGGRFSNDAADLVQFLAFGGFRKSEAAGITWADVDLVRGVIHVRQGKTQAARRQVSIIPPMLALLQKLKVDAGDCLAVDQVMKVTECQGAMTRAAAAVGIARLTHHDLRHLFVTACVESGVDVSTIADWAGHSDRGALILKTYTNIRREHSQAMAGKVAF